MTNFPLGDYLLEALRRHEDWRKKWEPASADASRIDSSVVERALDELTERLGNNYPFFHPLYAGQMIKPPHPIAMLGYFATQLINPNNHALDGGPATGQMEKEVVADIASMFGMTPHLGHLTSSGTIANLEALWIANCLRPLSSIAFSSQAHYTHKRMCKVLSAKWIEIPSDKNGKMDLDALRRLALSENIGTVVATIGTTGLGALDPLDGLLELRNEFGFRIHADAAYGGFYRLLADEALVHREIFQALAQCDSIAIDPHKHGLQPYGCGCILFRDPAVGRFYKHDSPYTYFTSNDLHLGEISLECSRAGASAAALWFTLRCFPLTADGLGSLLSRCRRAALAWTQLLRTSTSLSLLLDPELDIVTYFAGSPDDSAGTLSRLNETVFRIAMEDPRSPVYVSILRVPVSTIRARYPSVKPDQDSVTVLRSCLMKPEHADVIPELHGKMESFARIAEEMMTGKSEQVIFPPQ